MDEKTEENSGGKKMTERIFTKTDVVNSKIKKERLGNLSKEVKKIIKSNR